MERLLYGTDSGKLTFCPFFCGQDGHVDFRGPLDKCVRYDLSVDVWYKFIYSRLSAVGILYPR